MCFLCRSCDELFMLIQLLHLQDSNERLETEQGTSHEGHSGGHLEKTTSIVSTLIMTLSRIKCSNAGSDIPLIQNSHESQERKGIYVLLAMFYENLPRLR